MYFILHYYQLSRAEYLPLLINMFAWTMKNKKKYKMKTAFRGL